MFVQKTYLQAGGGRSTCATTQQQGGNKASTRRQQGDNKAAKASGRQINKASNEMQIENRLPKRERPREKEGNLFKTKIQPHEKRISCCSQ